MFSSETCSRLLTSVTETSIRGDLLRRRRALQLRTEIGLGLADPVEQVGLFLRQAEGAALVGQGVDDRLAHPPDGVGDELDALVRVEALGRLDQPDVALVDQVEERQAAATVPFGVGDDETQVGLDQPLQRRASPS